MVAVITTQDFVASVNVFGGVLTARLPHTFSDISLQIVCPDFDVTFALPIIDANQRMESGKVVLRTSVDSDSTIILTFNGELSEENDNFQIQQVELNIETTTKLARSDFVLASLRAMLTLSGRVYLQVPEIQLDLVLSFAAPLLDISKMLRRRQIAYRIMVIERAVDCEFELPPDISDEEVENIALIYHAIIERSFDWPVDRLTVFMPADEEWLNQLTFVNQLTSFSLGPDPISKTLFGKQISLGHGTLTVLNKFIENIDKSQQELARNDGHLVAVVVCSLSGQGRYELPDAPRLAADAWDEKIQMLIDLEDKLDAALTKRYHALAASTLDGLSAKEKTAIATRPWLDDDAFSIES